MLIHGHVIVGSNSTVEQQLLQRWQLRRVFDVVQRRVVLLKFADDARILRMLGLQNQFRVVAHVLKVSGREDRQHRLNFKRSSTHLKAWKT
jgi:hypothetical protein